MEKDTLAQIRDDFKACSDAESEQRKASKDDLEFSLLSKQWHEQDVSAREAEGRPCLTINRMTAFGNQVINDAKMNRACINVKPLGDGATKHTADIQSDLIRNIETASQAETAYDAALISAVYGGYGYFRVSVDYACDDAWDQDILIERIANPFSVYGDPQGKEPTSIDWNLAFVTDKFTKTAFERRWGKDRKALSFQSGDADYDSEWFKDDGILVAEHWSREEVPAKLLRIRNARTGQVQVLYESAWLKPQDDGGTYGDLLMVEGFAVDGERMTKTHKVKQLLVTGTDILEENEWLGKYIPIVPMYGEEVNVAGKRHFISLIRRAKDPQRAFNYWRSASTELVALAPKAPFIGAVGAFNTDAAKWATINRQSHAYVEYDPVDVSGAPIPPPQRQPFAGVPAGALQEALNASDDMKAAIGMYDASLGARSNETSGRAIMARQREGDTSTFHFIDNRNRAVEHGGRIILDLIPHYYTVGRIVRGIQEDGSTYTVPVKQPVVAQHQLQAIQKGLPPPRQVDGPPQYVPAPEDPRIAEQVKAIVKIFDPTTGKYDVTVTAGPSFTTRREESSQQMMEFIRVFPQAAPLIGDLMAKSLDWAGAEQIAERLKATLPPHIRGDVDPMVEQLKQLLQRTDAQAKEAVGVLQQKIGELTKQVQDKSAEHAAKAEELRIKAFEAETKRLEALKPEAGPAQPVVDPLEAARLQLEERELGIKAFEAETKRIDVAAKAQEVSTNAAALHVQQVEIPQATIAQNGEQFQAVLAALQTVAASLQPKPVKKVGNVIRDASGKVVGVESVEVPVDPVIGQAGE